MAIHKDLELTGLARTFYGVDVQPLLDQGHEPRDLFGVVGSSRAMDDFDSHHLLRFALSLSADSTSGAKRFFRARRLPLQSSSTGSPPQSAGATSLTVWVKSQRCPKGSSALYCRSPYTCSTGSVRMRAPAARARAQCARASSTRTITAWPPATLASVFARAPSATTRQPSPAFIWMR